ncbi:MAG: hypothetical protein KDA90_18085 [Planctomycetaceae bacterium]|nr:hypothetical protein [Planctomycetaceae bacterium]
MKKADRVSNAAARAARKEHYARQEMAMRSFFETCRDFMTSEQWNRYYPEAQRSAGETFHIVSHLVFALAETQVPIAPKLRKAIDLMLEECGVDRSRWTDLSCLNYDAYWRSKYGYDGTRGENTDRFRPQSPSEPSG